MNTHFQFTILLEGCNQRKYFESQKKWPEKPLKAATGGKRFAFYNAIMAYHYLSRNPKFAMEAVN